VALHGGKLGGDLLLVVGQRLGQRGEAGRQLPVLGLLGQRLRPVQRQVEMTAAIVQLSGPERGRLAVFEQFAGRLVERPGQDRGLLVTGLLGDLFDRYRQR